jgi:zinc protease
MGIRIDYAMNRSSRASRSLSLMLSVAVLVAVPQVAPARPGDHPNQANVVSALPPLPPQDDPWLYQGSDVPHDKEWSFGTLENGLRWAVRANAVPPGQVSIRIRMDVGSMYEKPEEAGFAHLIEHLVFRQSKYLGQNEAIPTWQRLGATLGSDTNAETTTTQTVFKIDLPNATPQTLDESFKLLSGMMAEPNLSESDIRTEVPIVLAEKRERGGTQEHVLDALREMIAYGQPLADHATIGSVATVEGAHQDAVRAFHDRWYRPENAAIIVSGDIDPRLSAALIQKWFGDWHPQGPHIPAPDFGEPAAPIGGDPDNPVTYARVLVESNAPRALTMAVLRPWHEKQDTITYNEGLMIDQVAQAIINRRLEARARAGASYLSASVNQQNESRSVDGTFVSIQPIDGQWQAALHDVRAVIADAMKTPPTPEEIAREVAEINVAFESAVQQRALQPGGRLADDLVQALDIHETVASPEVVLDIFKQSIPLFTPDAVLDHGRKLFQGRAIRALYVTPDAKDGTSEELKAALMDKVDPDSHARLASEKIAFADLPAIGAPQQEVADSQTPLRGIEQVDFANGVKVQLWPTQDDPGRVTVKVRFGGGARAFTDKTDVYALLGGMALVGSGEGKLGQEELDRITTGRKMGFELKADDGFFQFSADTRAEDLADQLYLFADKFADPRWDTAPFKRAQAAARVQYASFAASPQGVIERELKSLQRGGDPRFAAPTPDQISAATPEGFRATWDPILKSGPIEVQIFGDFNRDKALAALRSTFGALAARGNLPADTLAPSVQPPLVTPMPVLLRHDGDPGQAAAIVTWPTGGGTGPLRESRQLDVLSQVFANRLMGQLRERAGASYAPQVSSDWPLDLTNGGTFTASAILQPDVVPAFFTIARGIAADLATKPVSADELERVIEPVRQQIARASSSTAFFMQQIEGATQDPARYQAVRSLLVDYTGVSPQALQALAAKYLLPDNALRVAVIGDKAQVPTELTQAAGKKHR